MHLPASRLCSHCCTSPSTRRGAPNPSHLPISPQEGCVLSSPAAHRQSWGSLLSPGEAPRALLAPSMVYSPPSLFCFPQPSPFSLVLLLSPVYRLVPALGGDQSWGPGLEPGKGTALTPPPVSWAVPALWLCFMSQDGAHGLPFIDVAVSILPCPVVRPRG